VIINENGPTRDRPRCMIRGQERSNSFRRSDTYASFEWLLSIKCENEERVFYYFVFYFSFFLSHFS